MAASFLSQISFIRKVNKFVCRSYCEKGINKYSKTVFLPSTTIPLRVDGSKRKEMDEYIIKKCDFQNMYKQMDVGRAETFVLHDGPPYANGSPHIGHAVNKVLKDITNRAKSLQGYKVHYIPGWDCHGLPIELKASNSNNSEVRWNYGNKLNSLQAIDIRNQARAFAKQTIDVQKSAFQRWGVLADWNNRCYYTYDKDYVADQLALFYKIYEMGYIFRDFKPVYWSYSTRTALAEAELEYNDAHKSTSVVFKCLLKPSLKICGGENVFALVWTTTPWTIPCNKAICYASDKNYLIVQCDITKERYLIAAELKCSLENMLSKHFTTISELDGKMLKDCSYNHPITNQEFPFLPGKHVTTTVGTGLVHAAPAHGHDDFVVAVKFKIPVECFVDEAGRYTKEMGPLLEGKFVLKEGNQTVIQQLRDNVVLIKDHVHSYPYDWRSKLPVIIRASSQWFFDTDLVKNTAIESLNRVNFYPAEAKASMISQLKARPYWCISRQRVWGVPIPVFYDNETEEVLITKAIVDHLISLVKEHGTDFWWTLPDENLLPKHLLKDSRGEGRYRRGNDILDIWFDSGSSWNHVFKDQNSQADLLVEGTDQITGWFQSTLLLSCALRGKAPYKNLYIHGFAIDEKGKKMSKSVGNVVDPITITDGDRKQPCYGADVLRWWVADHAVGHATIPVGPSIMKSCSDDVQKIRIVLRYLAGIVHNFTPPDETDTLSLSLIDQYMLHQLSKFKREVMASYDSFSYNRVTKLIRTFIADDVSAFYCHLIKDRVYCESSNSMKRQSALAVTHNLLIILLQLLSPILPFLTEEVYLNHPSGLKPFQSTWNTPCASKWENTALSNIVKKMSVIRHELNKLATLNKIHLRDLNLTIISNNEFDEELKKFQLDGTSSDSGLSEFFQVAQVTRIKRNLDDSQPDGVHICHLVDSEDQMGTSVETSDAMSSKQKCYFVLENSIRLLCPRCRRRTSHVSDTVCSRCKDALQVMQRTSSV